MTMLSRIFGCFFLVFLLLAGSAYGKNNIDQLAKDRKALYLKTSALTGVRWSVLAGCDQYARNVSALRSEKQKTNELINIKFSKRTWLGPLNPNPDDENPDSIALFGGIGRDGNGDGRAELRNAEDRLYTFAELIAQSGPGQQNTRIGLWFVYQRGKAVDLIEDFARLYEKVDAEDLYKHAFPVPLQYNHDFTSTWGARRGWGGRRIHEGTDIFADYGTPVRATACGVVEMIGWNKYGGWRIGIRDIQGNYHYFAHLNGYAPGIHRNVIAKPGQVIGYVGSSGYGPKGTMGKFPPHLHYGLYRDNGRTEYSVDPYPALRIWERQERQTNDR
ncbi:M23 family metallopeptidase [Sporolactobacillus laevolacticus]|uniref:M23 family metallopeptidase n=1 Tax=Sporolactobacillus laevolacticus TaxID=33018 RepID=UPI0025B43451|nr:M23 family metallopeptidase [Sporolactobacillus laevolacticus]MDN3954300.1 M23 family metallopeptidase [Sporolactobacillus laevolacticus]